MSPDRSHASDFATFTISSTQLKQRLLDMSDLADVAARPLGRRAAQPRQRKAEAVIAGDRDVDALELEVEDQAIALLALQQPMARDLRFIIASIKVSSDLERVGDHAVNIAQSAQRLASSSTVITPDPEIEDMARRARKMLRDSLDGVRARRRRAWAARSAAPTTKSTRCTIRCSASS